jgi:RHS repeat-associated protein
VQPFGSAAYQYDSAGRRTRLTWADGFYVTYDYDTAGNVTAIRENGAASGIGVLATYTYDSLGRRAGITRGNGTTTSYVFDPVSRLSSLTQDLSGTANDLTIGSIAYNPAQQIKSIVRSNDAYAWNGHYNVNRGYSVNGLNQLTTSGATALGYDGRGNLTTSGTITYAYDLSNQMSSAPGVTIGYDFTGRMSKYNITGLPLRLAYAGSALIQEKNGPTTTALLRRYVPGPGVDEPVVWYEGSGTTDRRWLHADERGSVVAVSDAGGAALAINRYDEYGIPQSGNLGRFQYTGQTWLPELGMHHYKARMYSPTLGRFMQTDPIGYEDGLNWHNYVHSDPINGTDSTGLEDGGGLVTIGSALTTDIVVTGTRIQLSLANAPGIGFSPPAITANLGAISIPLLAQAGATAGQEDGAAASKKRKIKPRHNPRHRHGPPPKPISGRQFARIVFSGSACVGGILVLGGTEVGSGGLATPLVIGGALVVIGACGSFVDTLISI